MGNFVKDGVVYTLCPRDDVHCCSQRAPAAAAAAASDDDVVRIGDDLYLVTAVDSSLNLSSDLSGQSVNQSIRMSICISLHYLTTSSLQVCTPFLKASLKLYSTDIVLFQFMWKIVPHSWRCVVRTRDNRTIHTYAARCCAAPVKRFWCFTSAAQQRAARV